MLRRTPLKAKPKRKDAAMKRYHDKVAQMECWACWKDGVHVHHVRHNGLTSISKDDKIVCPLCPDCHLNGPNAVHKIGHPAFNALYDIDLYQRALKLWEDFSNER